MNDILKIPLLNIKSGDDPSLIKEVLGKSKENYISHVNWPQLYPSKPKASFKIAHNKECLFLHFFVEEDEIMAVETEDNGPVWQDSCVEFFFSLNDDPCYYNAEFSCIGTALLGYRKNREEFIHGEREMMKQIKRYPSLGKIPIDKKQGNFKWDLLVVIPVNVYWKSGLASFEGVKAKANFYKCGDGLTIPHYLSWAPIASENPDFHLPQFFKEIEFE